MEKKIFKGVCWWNQNLKSSTRKLNLIKSYNFDKICKILERTPSKGLFFTEEQATATNELIEADENSTVINCQTDRSSIVS